MIEMSIFNEKIAMKTLWSEMNPPNSEALKKSSQISFLLAPKEHTSHNG